MKEFLLSESFFEKFIAIIIYIIIGVIIYYIIKFFMSKALNIKFKNKRVSMKRQKTINGLMVNIFKYLIVFIVGILILKEFGINTTSLLASLGVVGLVVGLALQDTIKDFVSGVFIITDKEYEVGDFVTIDGFTGEIIDLGLKTTRIRAYTGEVKIINNSSVGSVINYSQYNSNLVLDINVSYEEDADKVLKILNSLIPKITKMDSVKKQVEVLGIESLEEGAVTYRMFIETKPYDYFGVKRDILKMLKKEFDNKNVKIHYPQIEVHNAKRL